MADAYLRVAEEVLYAQRTPLSPRQILLLAHAQELLPSHLHGPTQHKTLHARLSEDISRHREESLFFRTAPGTFFLRSLLSDPTIPLAYKVEHFAPPRRKELKRDLVLTIRLPPGLLGAEAEELPLVSVMSALDAGMFSYKPYYTVAGSPDEAVIHSFVVVHREGTVLSFRSGKFTPHSDPLYGRRSIGIGGAVFMNDVDMLYRSMNGIIANGIAELGYSVGLPRGLAERARYLDEVRPTRAVRLARTARHPQIVHIVLAYVCPSDFIPMKNALSINDLKWINIANPGNNLSDYDATSRVILNGVPPGQQF